MKIAEKKLVELLKTKYKFDVPEAEGKMYESFGLIKYNSNSYKSFIKKVESICESVMRLKKSRCDDDVYYEITGLKEFHENYNGGSGGNNSHDDQQMAAHIFNSLAKGADSKMIYGNAYTHKELAERLKLPLVDTKEFNKGINLLNLYVTQKQSYNIMTNYKTRIQTRSTDTIKSALNILKKHNHIQVETVYCAIDEDNKEVYYNQLGYLTVKEDLEYLFDEYKFSYAKWFYGNHNYLVEKQEIQERLLNTHGVKNIFKKYLIKLNHTNPLPAESDIYSIYFHKLDKLSDKLHDKHLKEMQEGKKNLSVFDEYHKFLMKVLNSCLFLKLNIFDIRETDYECVYLLQEFYNITNKRKEIKKSLKKYRDLVEAVDKGSRFDIYYNEHKELIEELKLKLEVYE